MVVAHGIDILQRESAIVALERILDIIEREGDWFLYVVRDDGARFVPASLPEVRITLSVRTVQLRF
jgi:hypothetical protein